MTERTQGTRLKICAAALIAATVIASCYRPAYLLPSAPYVPCPPGTPSFTGDSIVLSGRVGLLRGRVVDFETGVPIQGTLVMWSHTGIKTVADSAGFFRLPVDTAGAYRLEARMIGYVRYLGIVVWTPTVTDSAVANADTSLALPIRFLARRCGIMT